MSSAVVTHLTMYVKVTNNFSQCACSSGLKVKRWSVSPVCLSHCHVCMWRCVCMVCMCVHVHA